MKHTKILSSFFLISILTLTACVRNDIYNNNAHGNFEALWKIIDEHYCFFQEKQIDWNKIHTKYIKQINEEMTNGQLFEVMTNMLSELKDGHVNLYSSFNIGRYWSWYEEYPQNFYKSLERKYLGHNYRIVNGMSYTILNDNIGYLRCSTFQTTFGAGNLDEILLYMQPAHALIIDLRNNGGGNITAAEQLAARFTNKDILVGYMQHKTGPGHTDFSILEKQILKPSKGIRWQKTVIILTNRSVYSAANEFVKYMKCIKNAIIVGDRTGGGAGLPFSSELPNGWSIRFSAAPIFDRNKITTEFGIEPDYKVNINILDLQKGKDTIIEYARKIAIS